MKNLLLAVAAVMTIAPSLAADVGALGGLGEPGYGQIDIHRVTKPQLVNSEPVVIRPMEIGDGGDPVYLYVPPDHARDWRKHCQQYNACDQRVYFVEENWYNKVYVLEYRGKRDGTEGTEKNQGKARAKD